MFTDYNELVEAFAQVIEESEGNVPDSGVPLMLPTEAYAAYAYLNGYTSDDLSDFYSDAEDAYQGEYDSDEDFAMDLAESIGAIDPDAGWPLGYIDWNRAARDLMMDYSEHDRYYFRD